ncbi:MAG: hypothetical protein HND47_14095 [Chloroflexi bacterium]|nr:hypothetical protein [Chloroflexota bacterium]
MTSAKDTTRQRLITLALIAAGIALRFLVSARGHNYDFDSYMIVINILERGGNVYAETTRYNYGPIWFSLLSVFYNLANGNQDIFRFFLVLFLSLVDVGIFLVLRGRYGNLAGILFFLNPISILITGYHNQFDNLALLTALCATLLFGSDFDAPLDRRKYAGLVLLGISITTKHLFFLFPIWLLIKQKGRLNKILIGLIPTAVFLVSFIPFSEPGWEGIVKNVFQYQSYENGFFHGFLIPPILQLFLSSRAVWIATLTFFGFYFRKADGVETFLNYTCLLVAASPAITNQYLAIPASYTAVNPNPFSILYMIFGTMHLILDIDGLHMFAPPGFSAVFRQGFYFILIALLWASFIWRTWEAQIRLAGRKIADEIRQQLA